MASDLLVAAKIVGARAYDARIAAVCLQYGVTELWTNDRDFLHFPALRVQNPLIDIHPTRAGESPATDAARSQRSTTPKPERTAPPRRRAPGKPRTSRAKR